MLKVRLHGFKEEIEEFKDKLAEDYNLLNVSNIYEDKGDSKYSRLYIELEKFEKYNPGWNDPLILRNQSKVKPIADLGMDAIFHMEDLPKNIIVELLRKAVSKISDIQAGEFDERDAMDVMCDNEFVFEELIKDLQSDIETGIYEEEIRNG